MSEESDMTALVAWLAKYQDDLNRLRYRMIGETREQAFNTLVMHWPTIQGTANQHALARLGKLPVNMDAVQRAVAHLDPKNTPPAPEDPS